MALEQRQILPLLTFDSNFVPTKRGIAPGEFIQQSPHSEPGKHQWDYLIAAQFDFHTS